MKKGISKISVLGLGLRVNLLLGVILDFGQHAHHLSTRRKGPAVPFPEKKKDALLCQA